MNEKQQLAFLSLLVIGAMSPRDADMHLRSLSDAEISDIYLLDRRMLNDLDLFDGRDPMFSGGETNG